MERRKEKMEKSVFFLNNIHTHKQNKNVYSQTQNLMYVFNYITKFYYAKCSFANLCTTN